MVKRCTTASDCGAGDACTTFSCNGGSCVASITPGCCLGNSDCNGDICDLNTNTCVECLDSDDCNSGQECSSANTCIDPPRCEGSCDDGKVCTTDVCNGDSCEYTRVSRSDGTTCCDSKSDCYGSDVCDNSADTCVECLIDNHCGGKDKCITDGVDSRNNKCGCLSDDDCYGSETCNLATNTCGGSSSSSSSTSSPPPTSAQCTNIMPCQGITTNKGWCSYMQEVADQYIPDLYWIYTPPTAEYNQYEGCCDCIGDDSVCPGGGTDGDSGDTGGGSTAVIFGDRPSSSVVSGLKLSTFVMSLTNDQSQALDFFDSSEFRNLAPTEQKELINAFYDSQNIEELNIFLRSMGLVSNAISSLFSIFN